MILLKQHYIRIHKKSFNILCGKYGTPKKFQSEEGRQYISSNFKHRENQGIKHIQTAAYNPTYNGISERLNSTISTICRSSRGKSISKLLRNLYIGLNLPGHIRLGLSPFDMVYEYSVLDAYKRNLKDKIESVKLEGRSIVENEKKRIMHK